MADDRPGVRVSKKISLRIIRGERGGNHKIFLSDDGCFPSLLWCNIWCLYYTPSKKQYYEILTLAAKEVLMKTVE